MLVAVVACQCSYYHRKPSRSTKTERNNKPCRNLCYIAMISRLDVFDIVRLGHVWVFVSRSLVSYFGSC